MKVNESGTGFHFNEHNKPMIGYYSNADPIISQIEKSLEDNKGKLSQQELAHIENRRKIRINEIMANKYNQIISNNPINVPIYKEIESERVQLSLDETQENIKSNLPSNINNSKIPINNSKIPSILR